jgi:hypothetical protein
MSVNLDRGNRHKLEERVSRIYQSEGNVQHLEVGCKHQRIKFARDAPTLYQNFCRNLPVQSFDGGK